MICWRCPFSVVPEAVSYLGQTERLENIFHISLKLIVKLRTISFLRQLIYNLSSLSRVLFDHTCKVFEFFASFPLGLASFWPRVEAVSSARHNTFEALEIYS